MTGREWREAERGRTKGRVFPAPKTDGTAGTTEQLGGGGRDRNKPCPDCGGKKQKRCACVEWTP